MFLNMNSIKEVLTFPMLKDSKEERKEELKNTVKEGVEKRGSQST